MADNVITGMTPRLSPRPRYPSLHIPVMYWLRSALFSSAFLGTILTYALYPAYMTAVNYLKSKNIGDALILTILLSVVHTVLYIIINGTLYICDKYKYFQEYKLWRNPAMLGVNEKLLAPTLIAATISQLITSPLLTYYIYPIFLRFGMTPFEAELPDTFTIFKTMLLCHLFNEFGFYFTHRLLHSTLLYGYIHKQHHEYKGTIGLAAEYAHPVEVLLSNIVPTIGGFLLVSTGHPLTLLIWLGLRLEQTYMAHSGYCFKNTILDYIGLAHAENAAFHDYHHAINSGNFGSFFSDYIFGTCDKYLKDGGYDAYCEKAMKKQ